MKIAVASTDGKTLSQHFGQSAGFIVFDIVGTEIKSSEWRTVSQTPHNAGVCGHGSSESKGHGGFLSLIDDCKFLMCGGIGGGAAQAVMSQGLQPLVVAATGAADAIVSSYIKGELATSTTPSCQCHH